MGTENHTKGKLIVDDKGVLRLASKSRDYHEPLILATAFTEDAWQDGDETPESQDNARRLAACWNACDGIGTDVLESEASAVMGWTRTASKLIRVAKERHELLEALESAMPKGVSMDNSNIPDGWKVPVDFTMGELRAMAATIAKVKASNG